MEIRCANNEIVVRAEDGKPTIIEGYSAMYNSATVIWNMFEEEIAPGFFDRALSDKQDVRALYNHDANYVLGRTKSGTLRLRSDEKGLWMETECPSSPIASSIVESIRRGDVDGQSFAFTIKRQEWIFAPEGSDKMDRRRLLEVGQLYDVGPVTYPAYQATSAKVREETARAYREAKERYVERNRKIISQVPEGFELCVLRECRSDSSWLDEEASKYGETMQTKSDGEATAGSEGAQGDEAHPAPEASEAGSEGAAVVEGEKAAGDESSPTEGRSAGAVIRAVSIAKAKLRMRK